MLATVEPSVGGRRSTMIVSSPASASASAIIAPVMPAPTISTSVLVSRVSARCGTRGARTCCHSVPSVRSLRLWVVVMRAGRDGPTWVKGRKFHAIELSNSQSSASPPSLKLRRASPRQPDLAVPGLPSVARRAKEGSRAPIRPLDLPQSPKVSQNLVVSLILMTCPPVERRVSLYGYSGSTTTAPVKFCAGPLTFGPEPFGEMTEFPANAGAPPRSASETAAALMVFIVFVLFLALAIALATAATIDPAKDPELSVTC